MKRIVTLWVTAGDLVERMPNWLEVAREVAKPLAPVDEIVYPAGVHFVFHGRPEGLEQVQDRLRVHGFDVRVIEQREYAAEELLSAEFLEVGTEAVVHAINGTLRWNWEPLCSHCDFFVERWDLDALRIKTAPKGYRLARVDWSGPRVVSAPLAEAFRGAGFSGLELVPVKGQEPSAWYVLQATHILPPMAVPPTRMKRGWKATPRCTLDHGWSNPDSELFYRQKEFEALDFNYTYEIFGGTNRTEGGSIIGSTGRMLVVSNRVYRLLVELGVKQLVCEPIRFVE